MLDPLENGRKQQARDVRNDNPDDVRSLVRRLEASVLAR
jgi:hypothetical protein